MISPDPLSVLMRGIQARHLDWGARAEPAQPGDEGFARLVRDAAGQKRGAGPAHTEAAAILVPDGSFKAPAASLAEDCLPGEDASPSGMKLLEDEFPIGASAEAVGPALGERGSEAPEREALLAASLLSAEPARPSHVGEGSAAESPQAVERRGAPVPRTEGGSASQATIAISEAEHPVEQIPADEDVPTPERPSGPALAAERAQAPSAPLPHPVAPGVAEQPFALAPGEPASEWRLGAEPASSAAGQPRDPAAGAAGPTSAPPGAVAGQVALAIRASEADRIEIRLDPPELGRVQIEMRVVEGALHAVVVAERTEVSDLLRRHAELLQHDLEAAGYCEVTLDFAAGHQDGSERQSEARGGRPVEILALDLAATPPGRAGGNGRLDIRL